jgi:DNA-binding IclR family transcriptional regulator
LRLLVHMPVGRRIPMYCSSTGRVYLAGLSDEEAYAALAACDRVKYTSNTLTDLDELMAQVRESREQGYAYCKEEYYRGDLALAVPVYDLNQRVVAGLQLSVSAAKWTVKRALSRFIPMMLETARQISTSPPTPRALAPFGGGAARDLHAQPPARPGGRKG